MNSTSFCMFMFSSPLASMFFWSSIGFASFFPTSRSGSIMDSSDKTLLPNSGKLSVNQDVSNVDIYEWLWHYNKWFDFLSKNFKWIRISTWLVRDKTLRELKKNFVELISNVPLSWQHLEDCNRKIFVNLDKFLNFWYLTLEYDSAVAIISFNNLRIQYSSKY